MDRLALQVSPAARSAYFKNYLDVARAELHQVLGDLEVSERRTGSLEFLELDAVDVDLERALQLSFVQGAWSVSGDAFRPLPNMAHFTLHDDFVFGSKYRGKTSEYLTQLLINVGLSVLGDDRRDSAKLLDPMCGRGTTLLWALRYGLNARGIEQDKAAPGDLRAHLKKWCKLHRVKHQLKEGSLGKPRRDGSGRFVEFSTAANTLKLVTGDTRQADELLGGERFDLLVSDLPYGVQHASTPGTRNPLQVVEESLPGWLLCMKGGAALVLSFNAYQPKRDQLVTACRKAGLEPAPFKAAHRMSESILRDVVAFRKA